MALNKIKNTVKTQNLIRNCSLIQRGLSDACDRNKYDVVIVGGGIIGLVAAREILKRNCKLRVQVVEKESKLALHQSTHNSGVVHAGIYYKPGSLKAKLCGEGLQLMYKYCDEKKIPYKKIGKIIVATRPDEVERLDVLEKRSIINKVPDLQVLKGKEIQEVEPHCRGLKALWSPHTGIVDYSWVARSYGADFEQLGGKIQTNFEVVGFEESSSPDYPVLVKGKNKNIITTKYVLTCAGLYSDKLAVMSGSPKDPTIIPFRGEYLVLHQSKNYLVKGNIYPVPDPRFPFLGVHFTPLMNGTVLLGPNAVLGFAREGYSYKDINLRELWEILTYSGFRIMAFKFLKPGLHEILKSVVTSVQMKDLQRYIPEITVHHVKKAKAGFGGPSGVRAQAMMASGDLVDDFVFSKGEGASYASRIMHCRNAPSPAATSSLAIAKLLADKLKKDFKLDL